MTKGRKKMKGAPGSARKLPYCLACAALGLSPLPALAQDAPTDDSDTITVTGTRLSRTGMQTPVPVTAVKADLLDQMAPGNLVEGISQLPQYYSNQTPNSIAETWFLRGGYGNINLRGLGINRTLTLLNGRRMISSTAFGGVDINVIPEAMLRTVETVTGGASAAYGTDAVAGVANFILDTEFTGLRAHGQVGETTRGDSKNYEASASFGADIGDRGHILVSGEIFEQDGVFNYDKRDWYQGWGTIPDAGGMLLIRPNIVSRNATLDGLIIAPGTSINGLNFAPDGSTSPFVTSAESFGGLGVPPARQSITNGGSGDDFGAEAPVLYPDVDRNSIFTYADYDVADNFNVFGQYIRGQNKTWRYNWPIGSLQGTPTAITIFRDNAFLPADIQQAMEDEDIASFTLKRMGTLQDIGRDMSLYDDSVMQSFTGGFKWDIENGGFMNGWVVDGYYQYGRNRREWNQIGLRVDRIHAAVDAVRDPDSGEIVCRTTLFNDYFEGCEPLNLFGRGNASAEAVDWVTGNDVGEQITTPLYFADTGFTLGETDSYTAKEAKVNITNMRQHLFELSANGEVFEGFGAGPISMAFGVSHREEKIRQIVRDSTNKSSDHNDGRPVLCDDNPIAIAAGLRGVSAPDCNNTVGIQYSKVSNIQGKITVTEVFAETLVPLIADEPFMKSLNLHGAARWADYSGSGSIWAWKGGLDAQFTDSFRLRGTYSRDVRAANLSERFDKTGGIATITDPRYPGDGVISVTRFSGGNPNVNPEKADTITVGAVIQPSFIDGLSISADWYHVKIKDAIDQLGSQAVVDRCEEGALDLCDLITRDAMTDKLVLVGDVFVNINQAVVSGVDVEVDYSHDVSLFRGRDESIAVRFFGTWLDENSETIAGAGTIDRAGQTGIQQSDGIAYALPEYKFTTNFTYNYGPFSWFWQGRYIGSGTTENTLESGVGIESNRVDSAFYLDTRVSYLHELPSGGALELYGAITNLLDKDPPITPYHSAFFGYSLQSNPSLFDVLGRRFVVGVKLNF
ncbi:MAG: TonB-dependent receptor [Parvularculaceae bacterium]